MISHTNASLPISILLSSHNQPSYSILSRNLPMEPQSSGRFWFFASPLFLGTPSIPPPSLFSSSSFISHVNTYLANSIHVHQQRRFKSRSNNLRVHFSWRFQRYLSPPDSRGWHSPCSGNVREPRRPEKGGIGHNSRSLSRWVVAQASLSSRVPMHHFRNEVASRPRGCPFLECKVAACLQSQT